MQPIEHIDSWLTTSIKNYGF